MNCPRCGINTLDDDRFCTHCGQKLEAVGVSEEALLNHQQIKNLAATHDYNLLSPLTGLNKQDPEEYKADIITLNEPMLLAVLQPQKVLYLTGFSSKKSYQKILLVHNATCYRWFDENGHVYISQEESPPKFLAYIHTHISQNITKGGNSLLHLKREQIKILKSIDALIGGLVQMGIASTFTTFGHLELLMKQVPELRELLGEMTQQGMVRLIGDQDPLVSLENQGREIVELLEDYDIYYNLLVMTEEMDEYPSFHFLVKEGDLYMLSNPLDGEDVLIRSLDSDSLKSLINWAWVASVFSQGEVALPEQEKPEYPTPELAQPSEQAPETPIPATSAKFCPNCGQKVSSDDKFCINCGNKLQ